MGKHRKGDPQETGGRLFWNDERTDEEKAKNFDDYDDLLKSRAKDENPYSKENFNK